MPFTVTNPNAGGSGNGLERCRTLELTIGLELMGKLSRFGIAFFSFTFDPGIFLTVDEQHGFHGFSPIRRWVFGASPEASPQNLPADRRVSHPGDYRHPSAFQRRVHRWNKYECIEDSICPLENKKVDASVSAFMESLPEPNLYNIETILKRLNQFSIKTAHYQIYRSIRYSYNQDSLVSKTTYEPLEAVSDESIEKINQSRSAFQADLQSLDPQADYIVFIVRENCFATFRRARKIAWDRGFKVGWEPMPVLDEITFTSGEGCSIGVQ